MKKSPLKIVMLGPSAEENSLHVELAFHYRGLAAALRNLGHHALLLEPVMHKTRQEPLAPPQENVCVRLYESTAQLKECFGGDVREADAVIIDASVSCHDNIGLWAAARARGVSVYYDLCAAETLWQLEHGNIGAARSNVISNYGLYLSSSGGDVLERIKKYYGVPFAAPLYRFADTAGYRLAGACGDVKQDLGYVGNYDEAKRDMMEKMIFEPARRWKEGRFTVAGTGYEECAGLPENVKKGGYIPPVSRKEFYKTQRFMLSLTGVHEAMTGFTPGQDFFDASACGVPVISDYWKGMELFLEPAREVLVASSHEHVVHYIKKLPEEERTAIGCRARARVLTRHTASNRAGELESIIEGVLSGRNRLCAVI